jgi:hypothetical protein
VFQRWSHLFILFDFIHETCKVRVNVWLRHLKLLYKWRDLEGTTICTVPHEMRLFPLTRGRISRLYGERKLQAKVEHDDISASTFNAHVDNTFISHQMPMIVVGKYIYAYVFVCTALQKHVIGTIPATVTHLAKRFYFLRFAWKSKHQTRRIHETNWSIYVRHDVS